MTGKVAFDPLSERPRRVGLANRNAVDPNNGFALGIKPGNKAEPLAKARGILAFYKRVYNKPRQ